MEDLSEEDRKLQEESFDLINKYIGHLKYEMDCFREAQQILEKEQIKPIEPQVNIITDGFTAVREMTKQIQSGELTESEAIATQELAAKLTIQLHRTVEVTKLELEQKGDK